MKGKVLVVLFLQVLEVALVVWVMSKSWGGYWDHLSFCSIIWLVIFILFWEKDHQSLWFFESIELKLLFYELCNLMLTLSHESKLQRKLKFMILILSKFISLFSQLESMIIFSNSVFESLRNLRLLLSCSLYKPIDVIEQIKRNMMRIDMIVPIKEIYSLLLGQCTKYELLFLCIRQKEWLSQERYIDLTCFCHKIKYFVHKNSWRYFVIEGEDFTKSHVLGIECVH